jgi:predicted SprT family Zn-dependent metalloprotease
MHTNELTQKFEAEAQKIMTERGLGHIAVTVEWNNRMISRAGDVQFNSNADNFRIRLAWKTFLAFGEDRIHRTFLHELAHVIVNCTTGERGHVETFKCMCAQLGGSMCTKYAGDLYADCATTEYLTSPVKVVYTCKCGVATLCSRRYSKKQIASAFCTKCGNSLRNFIVSAYVPSVENLVSQES